MSSTLRGILLERYTTNTVASGEKEIPGGLAARGRRTKSRKREANKPCSISYQEVSLLEAPQQECVALVEAFFHDYSCCATGMIRQS